jgi:hypothetical protein
MSHLHTFFQEHGSNFKELDEIKEQVRILSYDSVCFAIKLLRVRYDEEAVQMIMPDLMELRECLRRIIRRVEPSENFFLSRKLRDKLIGIIEGVQKKSDQAYSKRKMGEKDGDKHRPGSGGVGPGLDRERRPGQLVRGASHTDGAELRRIQEEGGDREASGDS